jgi:putative ABC transport system permease protein
MTPLLGSSKALVTPQSVVRALVVSLGIGAFFGSYPANRAASLHPIDALRHE